MGRLSVYSSLLYFTLSACAPPSPSVVIVTVQPPIPSNEPSYADQSLFTSAILNSTNTYRAEHNASAVSWNNTLATFATDYLSKDTDCKFAHSGGPYGENIAIGYATCTTAVEAWGDERKEYDFNKGEFTEQTGHFTQLVWKDTTTVGCGRMLCGHRGWFLACEYWPRGNVIGEFKQEVDKYIGPPKDKPKAEPTGSDDTSGVEAGPAVVRPSGTVNEPGLIFMAVVLVIITGLGTI